MAINGCCSESYPLGGQNQKPGLRTQPILCEMKTSDFGWATRTRT